MNKFEKYLLDQDIREAKKLLGKKDNVIDESNIREMFSKASSLIEESNKEEKWFIIPPEEWAEYKKSDEYKKLKEENK